MNNCSVSITAVSAKCHLEYPRVGEIDSAWVRTLFQSLEFDEGEGE